MATITGALIDAVTMTNATFLGLATGLVLKTSVLLGIAGLATLLLARRSAALRHFLWSLAIGGSLVLPVVAAALPELPLLPAGGGSTELAARSQVAGPAAVPSAATASSMTEAPLEPAQRPVAEDARSRAAEPSMSSPTSTGATAVPEPPASRRAEIPIAAIVWGVGVLALLLHLVLGRIALSLTARLGVPVKHPALTTELERIVRFSGMRRAVRLVCSARARAPMTWGVRRPVVLLPENAREWEPERIRLVLQHEVAHIRRMDDVTQTIAALARAVHWFNPLVWWAAARLREESEHASDDLVLNRGACASVYAQHLLDLVSRMDRRVAPSAALPLAERSRFEGRLLAILDAGRAREGLGTRGALALFTCAAVLVVLLGAVAPVRADDTTAEATAFEVPSVGSEGTRERSPDRQPTRSLPPNVPAGERPTAGQTTRPSSPASESTDERSWATVAIAETADPTPAPDHVSDPVPPSELTADPEAQPILEADTVALRALVRALLEDESAEVRTAAAEALGDLDDPAAVQGLGQALTTDTSVAVRRSAARALGEIDDPSGVTPLVEALSDEDVEVRTTSLRALGQIDDPAAVGPLMGALQDPSAEARRQAAWALAQIESEDAVDALIAVIDDADVEVRQQVIRALGQIESPASVVPLQRALGDAAPPVRARAAWALGQIRSPESVDALAGALSDQDEEVAAMAAWAIGEIEPDNAPPALLELARSGTGEARSNALRAIRKIRDPAAVPVLSELLTDADPEVKASALRGLAEIGDATAIRAITRLLDDPDPQVRAAAVRALGRAGR